MQTMAIKYGGNAIADIRALDAFAAAMAQLAKTRHLIIIHGGGPQINYWLERTGVESRFIDGQRYTDAAALEIVEMVLCAHVNKAIVRALSCAGIKAVGISGQDAGLITAAPNPKLGLVGSITHVDPTAVNALLHAGLTPVIAPLGMSIEGSALNINADCAAARIAGAVQADSCIFMTNVDGLLDARGQKIDRAERRQIEALIADGTISGGMIPKVDCALEALAWGVGETRILNGSSMEAILAYSQGCEDIGTAIAAV